MKIITKFTEVSVRKAKNGLLVLDIDETILRFVSGVGLKQWWNTTFDKHYDETADHEIADQKTLNIWINSALTDDVEHIDEVGLHDLLQRARTEGYKVCCVTARSPFLIDATNRHLQQLSVKVDELPVEISNVTNRDGVFYIGGSGKSKGTVIDTISKHLDIDHIIYIDDSKKHVNEVSRKLSDTDISSDCYLFCAEPNSLLYLADRAELIRESIKFVSSFMSDDMQCISDIEIINTNRHDPDIGAYLTHVPRMKYLSHLSDEEIQEKIKLAKFYTAFHVPSTDNIWIPLNPAHKCYRCTLRGSEGEVEVEVEVYALDAQSAKREAVRISNLREYQCAPVFLTNITQIPRKMNK